MLRVLSIFGTRPEAVKMAPVVKALEASAEIESLICVTAQHREMLDQVLGLFKITPDLDLNLMRPDQSLAQLTSMILEKLDVVLTDLKPDWLLVQGDTTTVMAAALLGYYHKIKVGHVEAGLRTGDKWQPFPEEVNRRIAGVVADLHFAPTEHSRQNLLAEGVPDWRISVTGNPVVDALQSLSDAEAPAEMAALLKKINISKEGRKLVLVTAHRRENFGKPLENICEAINILAKKYAGILEFVYAVHLNPNVREVVFPRLQGVENITLLDPLDYPSMIHLLRNSTFVMTDSGGIQEEATALNVPTLVLREVTERPEGVEAGILNLVGTNPQKILFEAEKLLEDAEFYQKISNVENPFGDGKAAEKIVKALLNFEKTQAQVKRETV